MAPRTTLKRLWIHIGRAKTGTSALQQFLTQNESILCRVGYRYAQTARFLMTHHPLAWSLHLAAYESGCGRYWPNARNYAKLTATADNYWQDLLKEIDRSEEPNTIISSEEFGVVLDLDPVFHWIAQYAGLVEIRVVVYLRRQDDFLQAVYAQAVKDHPYFAGDFGSHIAPILAVGGADHYKTLSIIAKHLGQEAIVPRIYEEEQLQGNIFIDFLQAIGVPIDPKLQFGNRPANPSLTSKSLLLARALNRLHLPPAKRTLILERLMDRAGSKEPFSSYAFLPPEERAKILDRFRESNKATAKEFLGRPDGRLFYAPEPSPDDPWEPPVRSEEDLIELLTEMAGAWDDYVTRSATSKSSTEPAGDLPVHLVEALRRRERPLVVWGAGSGGAKTLVQLERHGCSPDFFVDVDPSKWNSCLQGFPVHAPKELVKPKHPRPFVIVGSVFAPGIAPQLSAWGYAEGTDYWVNHTLF